MRLKCQRMLSPIGPEQLEWPASDGMSIRELLGLILIELDRLSSRRRPAGTEPAAFAVEFMDRQLASRLSAKYSAEVIGHEIDRRFAAAIATSEAAADSVSKQGVNRLEGRLAELFAALKARRTSP